MNKKYFVNKFYMDIAYVMAYYKHLWFVDDQEDDFFCMDELASLITSDNADVEDVVKLLEGIEEVIDKNLKEVKSG